VFHSYIVEHSSHQSPDTEDVLSSMSSSGTCSESMDCVMSTSDSDSHAQNLKSQPQNSTKKPQKKRGEKRSFAPCTQIGNYILLSMKLIVFF
jgi:hypothetical protein